MGEPVIKKEPCSICGRRVTFVGMGQHLRDVHKTTLSAHADARREASARAQVAAEGDTEGDYWREVGPAMDKASQERRSNNRDSSAQVLQQAGIAFTTSNGGVHLVVTAGTKTIDFWPGTGLWIVRGDKKKWRGVRNLINHITRSAA